MFQSQGLYGSKIGAYKMSILLSYASQYGQTHDFQMGRQMGDGGIRVSFGVMWGVFCGRNIGAGHVAQAYLNRLNID